MKYAKLALICILCVPMGLSIGIAYLLGMLIRALNKEREIDPYDGPGQSTKEGHDGAWFF